MTMAKATRARVAFAMLTSLPVAFGDEVKQTYEPFALDYSFHTAVRLDADAMNSAARSPIISTVAWLPPDLVTRGITDASTTDNPFTPLTLQY